MVLAAWTPTWTNFQEPCSNCDFMDKNIDTRKKRSHQSLPQKRTEKPPTKCLWCYIYTARKLLHISGCYIMYWSPSFWIIREEEIFDLHLTVYRRSNMEKISSHLNRINHLSTIGFFLSLSLCVLLACMSKLKMMRYKKKKAMWREEADFTF